MSSPNMITVISGQSNSTWEPKHTKARISSKKDTSNNVSAAHNRRTEKIQNIVSKVATQNEKVETVKASNKDKHSAKQTSYANLITSRQKSADQKREVINSTKVKNAQVKKVTPPAPKPERTTAKQAAALERRDSLTQIVVSKAHAHHDKVGAVKASTKALRIEKKTKLAAKTKDKQSRAQLKRNDLQSRRVEKAASKKVTPPPSRQFDAARQDAALKRRESLAKLVKDKISAHHAKVNTLNEQKKAKSLSNATMRLLEEKVQAADDRRKNLAESRMQKIDEHHKKVNSLRSRTTCA